MNAITQAARRFWNWLPTGVDRRVRVAAWLNLVAQTILVGTGGAVRLTGSGLGCPTWPRCTAESFISTPEMGIHGVIEFGNRTLFFVLQVIALAALFFVLKYRRQRRDLFILTLIPACSVLFQAVVGGITVLSGLNPYVVGLHFVLSVVLVSLGAVLVYRVYNGNGIRTRVVPKWYAITAHITSFFVAVTVIIGIITTGSGPHAGDSGAARNGLDSELLQHFHAWPAYVTFALTLVLVAGAWALTLEPMRRVVVALLVVELVQIGVGLAQARMGLPEILVGLHMVLACVLAAVMTVVVLSLKATASVRQENASAEAVTVS
ncbi:COX15/CtaA family protein [Okibacterium sp. HSC-33S16]|uniref:COX15/CtaA family protein n=1 Tax=Okibacterium sp. HSC-33S16 TaxID=2910965 RepID=UPI0027E26663|nr:COX15/CtaA family protein [Okibacterium sp. HSC-33S16]